MHFFLKKLLFLGELEVALEETIDVFIFMKFVRLKFQTWIEIKICT